MGNRLCTRPRFTLRSGYTLVTYCCVNKRRNFVARKLMPSYYFHLRAVTLKRRCFRRGSELGPIARHCNSMAMHVAHTHSALDFPVGHNEIHARHCILIPFFFIGPEKAMIHERSVKLLVEVSLLYATIRRNAWELAIWNVESITIGTF